MTPVGYTSDELRQLLIDLINSWQQEHQPQKFVKPKVDASKLSKVLSQRALIEILPELLAANNKKLLEDLRSQDRG